MKAFSISYWFQTKDNSNLMRLIFFILVGLGFSLSSIAQTVNPAHLSGLINGTGGALLSYPRSVFISGNYAYVASYASNALEIVDVTNPATPIHKGSLSNGTGGALLSSPITVFVSGNYAYVTSSGSNSLEIIDVTNPATPTHKGSITNGTGGALLNAPVAVFVSGNYAYVTSQGSNALEIVDVTNPATPTHKGSIINGTGGALLNAPVAVYVSGNYAYVTSSGNNALEIVDVTNPATPTHKGSITNGAGGALLSYPITVFVSGNYAYVTSYSSNALEIVDVTIPATPIHKGSATNGTGGALLNSPIAVFVSGNYAYVASSGSNALEIVDVTNPTAPTHKSSLTNGTAGALLANPYSVFISGNYAYLGSVDSNALEIVSIFSPSISNFTPSGGATNSSVTITGINFDPTPANNIVKFNGTTAVVSASSSTSITTSVPAGTTTGKITVTVAGQTATSSSNFTVPDNTPPSVTDNTSTTVNMGNSISVVATITDNESTISSATINYRSIATGGNTTAVNLSGSGSTYTASIPSSAIGELGIEYKISATSTGGTYTDPSFKTINVNVTGSGLTVPYSSFGSNVSNYRIVSIPLSLTSKTANDVFGDDLGAYGDKTKWRMYRYENGVTTELSGSSSIDPGKGYWLIAKSGSNISTGGGTTVQANANTPFQINLVSGWNEIGNPYNFNLSWADVQAANSGLPGLRIYNGDFADATRLDKMQGGFVNVSAATTLTFPVIKNPSVNGRVASIPVVQMNSIDNTDWQVNLRLEQGDRTNLISGFGMNQMASSDFDIYDGVNMPKFFDEYLVLNHQKQKGNDTYSKDIVPFEENHIWEFSVESSSSAAPISFYWDNSYFGQNTKQVYLWDVKQQLAIDMRSHQSYSFNPGNSQLFKIAFGTEAFVKEKISVRQLVLHSAWPNPASHDVTISFSLPDSFADTPVEFSLCDVNGKRTQILQGDFKGGYNEVNFKRGDFAPGAYVINVSLSNGSKQSRIVFK